MRIGTPFAALLAVGLAMVPAARNASAQEAAGDGGVVPVHPEELVWRESPSRARFAAVHGDPARAEPFAFRMWMPAGFTMSPHTHNTVEHITVLSGTLYMSFAEGDEPTPLGAGSFAAIPAGTPMWGWTREAEAIVQIQGTGPFETHRFPPPDDPAPAREPDRP